MNINIAVKQRLLNSTWEVVFTKITRNITASDSYYNDNIDIILYFIFFFTFIILKLI